METNDLIAIVSAAYLLNCMVMALIIRIAVRHHINELIRQQKITNRLLSQHLRNEGTVKSVIDDAHNVV
jgi:hypothetical protein